MERTKRVEMLLGGAAAERLMRSRVAVVGLGGVGSWCAEALCRSGIGSLTLIDSDLVAESNINRQLEALGSTVGQPKAEALAARLRDIAPEADIRPVTALYNAENRGVLPDGLDYVADCIDLVSCKLDLIETAAPAHNRPGRDLGLPLRTRHAARAPPARDRAPRRRLLGRARARLRAA